MIGGRALAQQQQQQELKEENVSSKLVQLLLSRVVLLILWHEVKDIVIIQSWFVNIDGTKNCVSREEFDTLQKELHYWQNTTINILKKYLIDNEGN